MTSQLGMYSGSSFGAVTDLTNAGKTEPKLPEWGISRGLVGKACLEVQSQENKPADDAAGLVASPPPKEGSNGTRFLRLAECTLSRTPQVSHGTD